MDIVKDAKLKANKAMGTKPKEVNAVKKMFLLILLITAILISFSNIAFAHCGMCAMGLAYAQEGKSIETVSGEVICLGCTLKKEKGAQAQCSIYGHVNGLKTLDGKIWTFLENDNSTKLINDHNLAGKKIEIQGKKYENANYIEVESYKLTEE